ncbi:hypothetical protein EV360DRAFT_90192, partial [Lentinula raphanica]
PSPQPARPGSAQIEQIEQLASVPSPQPVPPGSAQIEQSASEFDPQDSHSQGPVAMRSKFKLRLGRVRNSDGTWATKKVPHSLSDFTYVLLFDDQERFDFPSISDPEDEPKKVPIPKRQGTNIIDPQFYWYLGMVRFPGNEEKKSVFETLGNFDKLKTECQEDEIRDSFEHAACALKYIKTAGYIDMATFSRKWPAIEAERKKDTKKKMAEDKAKAAEKAKKAAEKANKATEKANKAAEKAAKAQRKLALPEATSSSLEPIPLRVGRVSEYRGTWALRRVSLSRSDLMYVVLLGKDRFSKDPLVTKAPPTSKRDVSVYFWTLLEVPFPDEEEKHSVFLVLGNVQELENACGRPITNDFEYTDCAVEYIGAKPYVNAAKLPQTWRERIVDGRKTAIDAEAAEARATRLAAYHLSKLSEG